MSTEQKKATTPRLPAEVFSVDFNESLIHQALTSYMSNQRQGSVMLKNRSDVRGGGRKPWRQKGTGRARAGTIRSPLWVGGGVTFAHTKNHDKKINKKMAKKALASILSKFKSEKRLTLVEDVNFKEPKTKMAADYFNKKGYDSALLITNDADQNTMLAIRNLKNYNFLDAKDINPYDLLKAKHILLTHSAVSVIKESLKC